jgi:hypothetical protein
MRTTRQDLDQGLAILARLMGTQVAEKGQPGLRVDLAYGNYRIVRVHPGGDHTEVFGGTRYKLGELVQMINFAIQTHHIAQDLQTQAARKAAAAQPVQDDTPRLYVLTDGHETQGIKWMTPDQLQVEQEDADRYTAGTWQWRQVQQ